MGQSTEELTSQIEDTRQRMASDLDALQDRVSPSAIVERRKQAVKGRFVSVRDKVMGTAHSAKDSVTSSASNAGSSVASAPGTAVDTAQSQVAGSPLAAGLVAFGAGMVIAALMPATRVEAEAAHRVVETAREKGQPLLDEARAAGEEVAGQVKQSAAEAAQQVKDSAQDSAETVQAEGQSSVASVRDQATTS